MGTFNISRIIIDNVIDDTGRQSIDQNRIRLQANKYLLGCQGRGIKIESELPAGPVAVGPAVKPPKMNIILFFLQQRHYHLMGKV